ncbi:phosphate/phosphite/phosphonate ABC transporter substrate-binding protein [Gracilibacillus caseinilyticus]|uniref:Phosphate/phosphite/phosphonate ABC transporter substrate-binding protein n=1 Tax=Gracilibacillus caseinilyticus TaxID=2932256 RepID=A0ABY4F1T3_9BACI|nr:phosphate/phosphite/phosphonate ABC transporter substrate-binding protein [Gracilibacillus caseinilyticus]UOQ50505.1 phosphate/phosphite/phosphonate ABC transporter substrate-binding protein [Gracilibacillus caseinilyticus]
MKKLWLLLVMALLAVMLIACGESEEGNTDGSTENEAEASETENESSASEEESNKAIDELSISFVPSREPDEITTATEPLKELLKEEMANLGYDIGNVEISVGTSYEAVGEALSAGTTDIGFIPGGTYVLYDDGAEVLLTSTRAGLTNDSDNAKDWNDNKPTEASDEQVTYYRALMIAGPSEKGQELAEKVNSGEELTFEDIDSASWAVMSTSSPAGYIYPALWLKDNFDKTITDLSNKVKVDSYGSAFARLAQKDIDVMVTYADARRDNADTWQSDFNREGTIWDETNVIGVTSGIYNDTISVSKNSEIMDEDLKTAIQQAFLNIAETEEGKEVISIYNHEGYQKASDADYDKEREAQEMVQSLN